MRDAVGQARRPTLEIIDQSPRSVSLILDPTGELISDVLSDQEGIAYGDIDVAQCVEPKQFHDVVGYYNRFDIFRLEVDRSPRDPAYFREGKTPVTADQGTERGDDDPAAGRGFGAFPSSVPFAAE